LHLWHKAINLYCAIEHFYELEMITCRKTGKTRKKKRKKKRKKSKNKEKKTPKKRHIIKELDFKLNKREKKWLELLVSQHDTARLSSDARDYLSNLLGKCGGNAATITSSYHTDDNEYDDVLNYNDGDD